MSALVVRRPGCPGLRQHGKEKLTCSPRRATSPTQMPRALRPDPGKPLSTAYERRIYRSSSPWSLLPLVAIWPPSIVGLITSSVASQRFLIKDVTLPTYLQVQQGQVEAEG